MKKFATLLLTIIMMLSLAACAGSNNDEPKNIYVILNNYSNNDAYWTAVEAGAKQAGNELSCNVIVQGIQNEADIEIQINMLKKAVSAGADAIIIAVTDSEAEAGAVSDAYQAGVPIIMIGAKAATEDYSATLLTNETIAGEKAAEELIKNLKKNVSEDDRADIAIQVSSADLPIIRSRMDGFKEYWKANAPANWELLLSDVKENDSDVLTAVQYGHDFLMSYPNLKGFFSPNKGSTIGFATALKEANRSDVAMVGFDFSPEIEALVRDGSFNVSAIIQNPYGIGYDSVKIALDFVGAKNPKQKDVDAAVLAVNNANINDAEVKAATGK